MIAQILLFPFSTLFLYVLPFLGVVFAKTDQKKWLGYWFLTLGTMIVVEPILTCIFEAWTIELIFILWSIARLAVFDNQKTQGVFDLVHKIVTIVKEQTNKVKEQVQGMLKQYGLAE